MLFPFAVALTKADPSAYLELKTLARGVYAVVRKEPPGLAVDCNVLFIERAKDVVMVDANIGPESAAATLSALAEVTPKPISTIIATHYHDDHMGGVNTVKQRFPSVQLIAHKSAPDAIKNLLGPARKQMVEVAPQMVSYLEGLMKEGRSVGGWPITAEERISYTNDIRIASRYSREMQSIPLPKPDILVNDHMNLTEGGKTIEVRFLGAGHTPSDLVVWLPKERIVAVGDLVVYPVPLVGGPQSDVVAWTGTLSKVRALKPLQILPGHGPVLRNDIYLKQMESLFSETTRQVTALIKANKNEGECQKAVDLNLFKSKFCGSSKLREVLFDNYVQPPSITSAFRILSAKKN